MFENLAKHGFHNCHEMSWEFGECEGGKYYKISDVKEAVERSDNEAMSAIAFVIEAVKLWDETGDDHTFGHQFDIDKARSIAELHQ